MREQLGDAIRAAGIEGRFFTLRHRLHLAEHFRGRSLVVTGVRAQNADAFEQIQRANTGHFRRGDGLVERHADKALCREVIQLVGLNAVEQTQGRTEVGQIVFDEAQIRIPGNAKFVHAPEVDGTGAPIRAGHLIALVEQQFRQIRAVLAGHAGDNRFALDAHRLPWVTVRKVEEESEVFVCADAPPRRCTSGSITRKSCAALRR